MLLKPLGGRSLSKQAKNLVTKSNPKKGRIGKPYDGRPSCTIEKGFKSKTFNMCLGKFHLNNCMKG
jgi:hypothetical protein